MNRAITEDERKAADAFQAPLPSQSVVVRSDSASIMEVISRAAADPAVDVDKLERLLAMQERLTLREAEMAFNDAMTAAQAEMKPVAKDCENKQTQSEYASYTALDHAMRPIYTRHGFSLSFNTGLGAAENYVRVLCLVSHGGGFSRTYSVDMPADGKGAKGGDVMTKTHAVGSALSYGARYLLKLIFNVAVGDADDDGNGAGDPQGPIDDVQLANLQDLIERTETNVEKFCEFMHVQALKLIKQKDFEKACRALNEKARKVKK